MTALTKNIGKSLRSLWKNEANEDIIKQEHNFGEGNQMERVAFIQSGSGVITLLIGQEAFTVATDHPNYLKIAQCMSDRNPEELRTLLDVEEYVENYSEGSIKIQEGLFMYDGYELHNTLTDRIMKLMTAGHEFKYMLNFLNNLMENPSGRAVQELYTFLEHRSLPITEDGCFLAYKSVTEDFKDWYSQTFDNSVGQKVSIPRNRVDDNCEQGCSYGLHVGAMDYVGSYGGDDSKVVIVKVNPKDCVSVPLDENHTKLRVCSYEVVDTYEGDLENILYKSEVGNVEEIRGMFDNLLASHWEDEYDYEYGDE